MGHINFLRLIEDQTGQIGNFFLYKLDQTSHLVGHRVVIFAPFGRLGAILLGQRLVLHSNFIFVDLGDRVDRILHCVEVEVCARLGVALIELDQQDGVFSGHLFFLRLFDIFDFVPRWSKFDDL